MIGFVAIFLALVATGIATFCYLNAYLASFSRNRKPRVTGSEQRGLLFYRLSATCIACASLYLYYIIFSNQFQYAYVFGHSSSDLNAVYKFSAFWAGQEGSFLLWALLHVGFGLLLPRKNYSGVLVVYSVIQSMLLVTLLAKSPFMMLAGVVPPEGYGLNPLLQDPWMVIHPPLVFVGYAGLAVPFAYAIDGLLSGRHDSWIGRALPWTLFSWGILGAGIFLGGLWAYKVLGWGGYWAWDPVENSSLVPWLAAGALLHLMLLARRCIAAVRSTYFAAIFTFVLVMYGTFLTRSGILSDFSTHSFTDEGVGGLLAFFVMITAVLSLGILIVRWPKLPDGALYPAIKSREFHLAAAALIFAVIGVIVLVGMSTPLITMLLGQPQNVGIAFYNTTTLPLAAALVMLLVTGQLVGWGEHKTPLLKRYWWLVVIGHVAAIAAFKADVHQLMGIVTVGLAVAALIASLIAIRTRRINSSAALTHVGVAVALVGIVFSSMASQSVFINFEKGESQEVLGAKLTYTGVRMETDNAGFYHSFALGAPTNTVVEAFTKLNKEGRHAAHEPGIYRGLDADIYLAPIAQHEENQMKERMLTKDQQIEQDGLTIKLVGYGMGDNSSSGDIRVYALLEVTKDGKLEQAKPELISRNGQMIPVPVTVFEQHEFYLTAINLGQRVVGIGLNDLAAQFEQNRVDVEVSRKPLINLVWLGTLLMTVGTTWAGWMRMKNSMRHMNNFVDKPTTFIK